MTKIGAIAALLLAGCVASGAAPDFPAICADRAAVERVYYGLRTGEKPPFETAMPTELLGKLVRDELKKEAVLDHVYGVKVTDAMVEAEVKRIDSTTRAPETLAAIRSALGQDRERFAHAVARPIVVERLLRMKFENDDAIHVPQRRSAEAMRSALLATAQDGFDARLAVLKESKAGEVQAQVKWELAARPAADALPPAIPPAATQAKARGGIYSNEATAQLAQVLSSPQKGAGEKEGKFYFGDLPADLQQVLNAQLRKPGDVSAVIESAQSFQVFLARERTPDALTAAILTIPKRSYEEWLAKQPGPKDP